MENTLLIAIGSCFLAAIVCAGAAFLLISRLNTALHVANEAKAESTRSASDASSALQKVETLKLDNYVALRDKVTGLAGEVSTSSAEVVSIKESFRSMNNKLAVRESREKKAEAKAEEPVGEEVPYGEPPYNGTVATFNRPSTFGEIAGPIKG